MRMWIAFCTLWLASVALSNVEARKYHRFPGHTKLGAHRHHHHRRWGGKHAQPGGTPSSNSSGSAEEDTADSEFRIVCYYASWADYRTGLANYGTTDINATLCTHWIYAFVGVTEDGEVEVLDAWNELADDGGKNGFGKFVALRESSPDSKFMVSIGGWSEGSVKYSNAVATSESRSKFAASIVNFTLTYNFDGFDIDWEYPNQRNGTEADVQNFVLLLEELRPVFDEYNLTLSVAVAAGIASTKLSYNITGISAAVDFINLMTYEYHSTSEAVTGHNTPLYPAARETTEEERGLNVNTSVNYWLDEGAPPGKIVLGTAFYGKSYTLNDSAEHEPGSPSDGAGDAGEVSQASGTLFYYEVCERALNETWTVVWDEEQHVPYMYKDDQWVSYDNVRSIEEKANYIVNRGLGGAVIWSIDEDDFNGICGEPRPLLSTLNAVLRN